MKRNKQKPNLTSFKTWVYSIRALHTQVVLAFYCLLAVGCTGQTHKTHAAEPVRWSRALLQQSESWYAAPEAIRIADNLLLYQRDSGGWDKNTDMAKVLSSKERAMLQSEVEKKGEATIDNNATFTQMEFLAKVYKATGQDKYKQSFLRGVDYLLEAQYENGGWPQFYPIKKGYYEHITFNDGAMIGVMELLTDVAHKKEPYTFVDTERVNQAARAVDKGIEVILKTQVKVNGKLTVWCAQHDRYDLSPQKARAYELPSLSGGETVDIVKYLMAIENPSPAVMHAIEGAVVWLEQVKFEGIRLERVAEPAARKKYDVVVIKDPSAPPMWARFYDINTNQPMFVGRDGIVRENLSEIEEERRNGYNWYSNAPQELLEKDYPQWKQQWVTRK
ncbi:pectate lyase [Pontibacter harenae]|uniref:pectate lyase n=1 Tax=Pontibacter harenae TaxID=2894083 RepID=UPI001E631720|nr:pectate lyase [Pontibacter harenae]MCC9168215.1 pectate lyase [Pontibacter harenae]